MSNMNYGLYKRLTINFAVVDHVEILSMLALPQFKYTGARLEEHNSIKYYRTGFSVIKTSTFLSRYGALSSYKPTTDYVLLLSMSKDVAPNRRSILKTRNKVVAVFPIDIRLIREGDQVHSNIGLSLDPDKLEYNNVTFHMYSGVGELRAQTNEVREYKEQPQDLISELHSQLDPVFDRIGSIVRTSAIEIWDNENGRNALLSYIEKALTATGVYTDAATPFRIELGQALIAGKALREVKQDDVTWDSPEEYAYALQQAGGDVNKAKDIRRNEMRLKWLLDDCTLSQRLRALTVEEINNREDLTRPNITLAMTDRELDIWYKTDDKEHIAQIELDVLIRWRQENAEAKTQ